MAIEGNSGGWNALSSVWTLLASVVAVLAALGAVVGLVLDNFATSGALRCAEKRLTIVEYQILAANYYARYLNAKGNVTYAAIPNIEGWQVSSDSESLTFVAGEERGKAMVYWRELKNAEAAADEATRLYRKNCETITEEK